MGLSCLTCVGATNLSGFYMCVIVRLAPCKMITPWSFSDAPTQWVLTGSSASELATSEPRES